ncbi:MAG: alpha/beta fold hydrolase [Ilumatobacteraceae bacterium]
MGVDVALLGELRVVVDGVDVTPRSPKGRAVLAFLAVRANQVVAADRLVDELWPGLSPDQGRRVLQVRVAEIRKQFGSVVGGSSLVESVPPGYRLNLPADALDSDRFAQLVEQAAACADDDPLAASTLLRHALGLWRGEALADVQASTVLEIEAARLDELRLAAIEDRIAAELADGCHHRLIPELDAMVAGHPLRERLWQQRILALYRCGRQAEALRAGAAVRRRLREELGVEPGPALRVLETAVLEQRPELDWTASTPSSRRIIPDPFESEVRFVPPPVRYVKTSDGVSLAYQVVGDGPLDLIIVPGYISELDNWWEAWTGRLVRRLASFSRLLLFDKRGTGLSDRPGQITIDDWVEDVRTVLDAVGMQRPAILGMSGGGAVAMLFAAMYPERTGPLVLYATLPRGLADGPDYPSTRTRQQFEESAAELEANWGTGKSLQRWCPSVGDDPELRAQFGQYERRSASPGAATTYLRTLVTTDVRAALPLIAAPTLVLHPAREQAVPVAIGRYTAAHIPGAKLVELDTADHLIWFSEAIDAITDNVESFLAEAVATDAGTAFTTVVTLDRPGTKGAAPPPERYGGRLIEDGDQHLVASFGGPVRAVRYAVAAIAELGADRAGVHSGACTTTGETVDGPAVSISGRLACAAGLGEVLVSKDARDLVGGSSISFNDRRRQLPVHDDDVGQVYVVDRPRADDLAS